MSYTTRLLTTAAILAIGAAAQSATAAGLPTTSLLASAAIYGSPAQVTANCSITNTGSMPVTISSAQIDDTTGLSFSLRADTCTGTLNPGLTCGLVANIFPGAAYTCRAGISPNKEDVRGVLELRDKNSNVIQNIPMQ